MTRYSTNLDCDESIVVKDTKLERFCSEAFCEHAVSSSARLQKLAQQQQDPQTDPCPSFTLQPLGILPMSLPHASETFPSSPRIEGLKSAVFERSPGRFLAYHSCSQQTDTAVLCRCQQPDLHQSRSDE